MKIPVYVKNEKAITAWQVENEPFLAGFGECPKFDVYFLVLLYILLYKHQPHFCFRGHIQ